MPAELAAPPARQPGPISAAELFSLLFQHGVQMTGELFADLEERARLTSKLADVFHGLKTGRRGFSLRVRSRGPA